MNSCVFIFVMCIFQISNAVIHQLNDEEHDNMPPTVSLDRFTQCLRRPGGWYCSAYVNYVADGYSPLLMQMQEYSEHKSSNFNHTRAFIGACITHKCKGIKGNTSDPRNSLEQCLNRTIWDEYKLKVKVEETVFCHEYGEKELEVRKSDIVVAGVLLILIVCNIVGSLFDIYYPEQGGLVSQFLQCFSIFRNWKMLFAVPGDSDPRLERFKGIYGMRAISMTLVIVAHGLLPATIVTENTKFVEDLYNYVIFHVLLNGSIIMQTFLIMSAFLLAYSCQLHAERHQITWKQVPMQVLKRWLRLTPSYALILALTATWLQHAGSGPVWDHMVSIESESCRSDWWQHLIYINNYSDDSHCMLQAWYLATDTQLYCLGLVIYVFCQSLGTRKVILSTLFIASLVVPALQTYLQDLDGPMLASPTAAVSLFLTDRTFNAVYKRGHTNVTCYIMGMVTGYLVYSMQKNNFDASKYKRPLYWALFPLGLTVIMACKVFYSTPKVGILYRAASAALLKPIFGLLITLFIVGMIFQIEKLYRGILEWNGWMTLSRVSYSAFLLHVGYIRIAHGSHDYPIRVSYIRMGEMALFTVTMVYILAYIFWLTVEAPLSQVVKIFLHPRTSGREKDNDKKKSN